MANSYTGSLPGFLHKVVTGYYVLQPDYLLLCNIGVSGRLQSFTAYSDVIPLWVLVWVYHHQAYVYSLEIVH
jgi:hypothetical protein